MKEHSQGTEWEGEKTEGGWRFGKGERERERESWVRRGGSEEGKNVRKDRLDSNNDITQEESQEKCQGHGYEDCRCINLRVIFQVLLKTKKKLLWH